MGSDQDVLTVPEAVYDPERPAAVRATGLLDTGPEDTVDRLARLAAKPIDAPMRFVTLGDGPADDDLALLVLRVRDDEVPWEQG